MPKKNYQVTPKGFAGSVNNSWRPFGKCLELIPDEADYFLTNGIITPDYGKKPPISSAPAQKKSRKAVKAKRS